MRSIRGGWSAPRRWFGVFVFFAIALSATATEPDGHIQLHADWVQADADADEGAGPRVLRLTIRSLVPLDQATLTVSAPVAFAIDPRTDSEARKFRPIQAGQNRRAMRSDLPHLGPTVSSATDFEVVLSPDSHGTLEFVVEGRDLNGRRIRNAIGFAASESGPRGVRRLGAVEFPATILPATGTR
jgi:hypothetical protein